PRAYLADRRPVILAEIGNRLVIRNQPTGEPHHLNVAASLTFKPTARLNPIEITVDVELQKHRRMVRRPAGDLGLNSTEPKLSQIEPLDKDLDHPNRIILIDPIFQAFRKQRALATIRSLNKAPHPILRQPRRNHTARITSTSAFLHSQGQKRPSWPGFRSVRFIHAERPRSSKRDKSPSCRSAPDRSDLNRCRPTNLPIIMRGHKWL